jgi:low temperature requirement protein LtrA
MYGRSGATSPRLKPCITVLGETVLTMGNALAVSFAGTVALWWCYFQRAEALGARAAENAEDAEDADAVGLAGRGR